MSYFLNLSFFTNHLLCPFFRLGLFFGKLIRRPFELFPNRDAA